MQNTAIVSAKKIPASFMIARRLITRTVFEARAGVVIHSRPHLHFLISHMAIEIMESDTVVEYVSEWPPRSKETTQSSSVDKTEQSISTNTSPPSTKRLKLVEASSSYACVECLHRNETTRQYKLNKDNSIQLTCCLVEPVEMRSECEKILQKLSSDEISIVNSDYTLSSDVLLARWWKMTLKMGGSADLEANTQEQRVLSLIKSNTAPQSQLYHISRYIYMHINYVKPRFIW